MFRRLIVIFLLCFILSSAYASKQVIQLGIFVPCGQTPKLVNQATIGKIIVSAVRVLHPDRPALIIINKMRMRLDVFMHYYSARLKPYLAQQPYPVETFVYTQKPQYCTEAKK